YFTSKHLAVSTILGLLAFPAGAHAQAKYPISPKGLRRYYRQANSANTNVGNNATATFVFVVWNGASSESDTVCTTVIRTPRPDTLICKTVWQGYRVRRTIEGITPGRLDVVGQWK